VKTILLILIIAIGLAVSGRAKRNRAARESAMASLSTEHDALLQNVGQDRQRLQMARDAHVSMRVVSPTKVVETASSQSRKLSSETALANNSSLLAEHLRCQHDVSEWWSSNMFRAVGLSAEQIEQWKQMIVQDEQRRLDLIAAVETQGPGRNSETFKRLNAENEKLRRAREAEILGELEPRYREYQRLDSTRNMVEWLARTGVYQEEAITGIQVERATQILAANTREIVRSGNGEQAPVIDWTAAAMQLKDTLSPAQIAMLQRVGQQFEAIGKASQRIDERTKLLTAQFTSQPRH
jgi:hypothetical protein